MAQTAFDAQSALSSPATFARLVQSLLSGDNAVRSAAEAVFTHCKTVPDACVAQLLAVMVQPPAPGPGGGPSPDEGVGELSAVLLRRVLTKEDVSLWPSLQPAAQAAVKAALLGALRRPDCPESVAHKVCDIISELAAGIVENGGWPELLPALFEFVRCSDARLVEAALLIFAQLAMYITDVVRPHLGLLKATLGPYLKPGVPKAVQAAALRAAACLVQALERPDERESLQELLPDMLAALGFALNAGDEDTAQEALGMFIEVAESAPRFMRRQLALVADAMLAIADSDRLEDATRRLAAEFLVTLAEARDKAPGMMRKLPYFSGRAFKSVVGFLLDIEDDPAWHSAEEREDDDAGEGDRYAAGQESLDRLALALGGNAMLPAAAELLPAWFEDPDWRKRHAALITLSQIAEGCSKAMASGGTAAIVAPCLKLMRDPHARVRWAAINAIGQLCTDLGPELCSSNHAAVLPALAEAMTDFGAPRVQAHAAAAIVNFSEVCDPDLLSPYLDGLVPALLSLLQCGKRPVQEAALTALASVADTCQEAFAPHYAAVMPYLTRVLASAVDKPLRLLRAKALECLSLVGMAVGKERFAADAPAVMQHLLAMQAAEYDADDPTSSYLQQAWARLCRCLGPDFLPYLAVVMPPLLRSAALTPDLTVADVCDDGDDDSAVGEDDVETVVVGDKRITIRTSALEEKATACTMLCCYADELKAGFAPWIDQTAALMVPLLTYPLHEDVRRAAAQALPELLRSAVLASEAGVAGKDIAYVRALVDYMLPPLVDALPAEAELDVLGAALEALGECATVLGPGRAPEMMGPPLLQRAFAAFAQVLAASEQRRVERRQRAHGEDFDADEQAALEEEDEVDEAVVDGLFDALSALARVYHTALLPYLEPLLPSVEAMLDAKRPTADRRAALCVVCDIVEYGTRGATPASAAASVAWALPRLLAAAGDADAEPRQAAVYGLGAAAQWGGPAAANHVMPTLAALQRVIMAPGARVGDAASATDNAISAVGKILEYQRGALGAQAGAAALALLRCLPLRDDVVEAHAAHEQLFRLVEAGDPVVLGSNRENVPEVLRILAEIGATASSKEPLMKPEHADRMLAIMRHFGAAP